MIINDGELRTIWIGHCLTLI